MHVIKIVLATLVVSVLVLAAATAGAVYTGTYNVAATAKHWPITHWVLHQTVHHSVGQRAANIEVPKLGARQQLLAGAANYKAMCSGCHTPPGAKPSPAARGMYPQPPNLAHSGEEMAAGEIYWILKHGIKASGMPAWGPTHSDDELWAMTAFVKQFPDMSQADYQQMLAAAEGQDIGHRHGDAGHHHGHDDASNGAGAQHDGGHADGHDTHHDQAGESKDHDDTGGRHSDGQDHPDSGDDAHAHG